MYQGDDFYCDEVLSGRTSVQAVVATDHVLAFHHTRPFYKVHIVVIPKTHIPSLLEASPEDLSELMATVRQVAAEVMGEHGACRVITNLGNYQDSKHLHWHVVSGGPMKD